MIGEGATVAWQSHIEVWFLVLTVGALGWYVNSVLAPKAVAAGYEPISRSKKLWFVASVLGLWVTSDWPIHDIAEEHLYFVHMFQHLSLSMLLPIMFMLSLPSWLFELVITPQSVVWRLIATGSRPVVAGVIFNVLTLLLHWTKVVQLSADNGAAHFGFHLLVFSSGALMWMPVAAPVKEWRLSPVAQCIYLFMMSIVPTVPGGWLVFAQSVVYKHYDRPDRLWGIDALVDQQAAGLVMKLVGGFFLWGVIVFLFSRWAKQEQHNDRISRRARGVQAIAAAEAKANLGTAEAGELTFEQVSSEFDRSVAPTESGSSEPSN